MKVWVCGMGSAMNLHANFEEVRGTIIIELSTRRPLYSEMMMFAQVDSNIERTVQFLKDEGVKVTIRDEQVDSNQDQFLIDNGLRLKRDEQSNKGKENIFAITSNSNHELVQRLHAEPKNTQRVTTTQNGKGKGGDATRRHVDPLAPLKGIVIGDLTTLKSNDLEKGNEELSSFKGVEKSSVADNGK